MKKIAIITGGSKGLGKGLVHTFLNEKFEVISLARGISGLSSEKLQEVAIDLSDVTQLENKFNELLNKIELSDYTSLYLIHNAASLGHVAPIDQNSTDTIARTIQLNYTTPAILNAILIRKIKSWQGKVRIAQISSGAASKAYFGWSLYCSSKAGLDMLTRTIALENAEHSNFKICSIDPGVMDTNMQAQIRKATADEFPSIERFLNYKKENWLIDPLVTAGAITETLLKDGYENGAIFDVKHMIYK
ncbi:MULTISPECIES: SDR family NAD(P)-dependent oxidoreductase [unclassified Paraflavitalea]|uniref:SDR family NAD(P)-dependent oxidoreductase n=1 Tax=unclassified Paraflavitalea TaxID=2798305 RepID=UPI003D3449D3